MFEERKDPGIGDLLVILRLMRGCHQLFTGERSEDMLGSFPVITASLQTSLRGIVSPPCDIKSQSNKSGVSFKSSKISERQKKNTSKNVVTITEPSEIDSIDPDADYRDVCQTHMEIELEMQM